MAPTPLRVMSGSIAPTEGGFQPRHGDILWLSFRLQGRPADNPLIPKRLAGARYLCLLVLDEPVPIPGARQAFRFHGELVGAFSDQGEDIRLGAQRLIVSGQLNLDADCVSHGSRLSILLERGTELEPDTADCE